MSISFDTKKKPPIILIVGLVALIALAVGAWQFFLNKTELTPVSYENIPEPERIEIDSKFLESPEIEELILFEEIPPFEGEIGRDNPFIPYEELPAEPISEEPISE